MSREHTSLLLKRAYDAGDSGAALALLEQSIALGHRRIALIRYLQASHLNAPLDERHHAYVREVAARMKPATLARIVGEARTRAARHSTGPMARDDAASGDAQAFRVT